MSSDQAPQSPIPSEKKTGSLHIIGTGIKAIGQLTKDALYWLEHAEKLFYVVADPLSEAFILQKRPDAESLVDCYAEDRSRYDTYAMMVDRILTSVRAGHDVCAMFYGHPGVFVNPSHEAIRRARAEGYRAMMLPAISAEDCLIADLGFDPAVRGCQMFEATDFLVRRRVFDPNTALILWQIAVVGDAGFRKNTYSMHNLPILVERLTEHYGSEHEVVIYEAAQLPIHGPLIVRVPLKELTSEKVTAASTLYVPPRAPAPLDMEMIERLGMQITADMDV